MGASINISQNGKHVFATSERSFSHHETRSEKFKDTLRRLRVAFPKEEGYSFEVTNWEKQGLSLTNEFLDILEG